MFVQTNGRFGHTLSVDIFRVHAMRVNHNGLCHHVYPSYSTRPFLTRTLVLASHLGHKIMLG